MCILWIGGKSRWELSAIGPTSSSVAAAGKLDRKAKTAVAGLLLVIAVIIAFSIRRSIVAVRSDSAVAALTPENQDEMIQIAGHTVLLKHGSAGNRIAHWLHPGSSGSQAFELGDKAFVAGSDALTPDGERRAKSFAQIMTHVTALKAQIFVSADNTEARLEGARGERLRGDMISKGVEPSRVRVPNKSIE